MSSMSTRLRRARRVAKLSQSQLAARLGIQRSAVAQWEQLHGTSPSVDHLAHVAVITGMCFEWLATGRGHPQPAAGEFEEAVTLSDFAQNEVESQALEFMRRLSPKQQQVACSMLGLLSR